MNVNEQHIFTYGGVDIQCSSIPIINHRSVENTETFRVHVGSFDLVEITVHTAIVNIQDNDGKFV